MKQLILGVIATLAVGSALAQQPAALVRSKGSVQVQLVAGAARVGDQAVAANSSYGAQAGDIVTVTDGSAKVTYGNGCVVTVTETAPYTIQAKDPMCRGGDTASSGGNTYAIAGGVAALLLVGAAAGGGGGDGGDDKPSSP